MTPYTLAPYDKLIVYQKSYTPKLVQKIIEEDKLDGLRIFAQLKADRFESLDFLKEYSFLERIDISALTDNDYDYSFLQKLKNLKQLSISIDVLNAKSTNILDLSALTNLKTLSINWRKGIQGLENCALIERLYLGEFKEENLEKVSSLINLKTLSIKNSTIQTLQGIQPFKLLEKALFGHCKRLKDVHQLDGLAFLEKLTFDLCPHIKSFNSLKDLGKLETLEIIGCKHIDTLDFLNNIKSIQNFKFGGTIILDGNLIPAQRIKDVFYQHKKYYNIKLDTTKQDETYKRNMQKFKELGFIK